MRRFLLLIVILLFVLYFGAGWYFSSQVIIFSPPEERTAEWTAIYAPDWDVPLTETVEIQNGDRVLVADVYDNPENADCGVIIVHGLGGERSLVRQYGPLFWQYDCDVMAYDFAPWHNDVFLSYGYYEKEDLQTVLGWFADYTGLPSSSIGIWSESYGAATALQMLAQQSDIAWLIADSPFASMSGILNYQAREQFGDAIGVMIPAAFFMVEQRAGFSVGDVSAVDSIAGMDVPLLLIHSNTDDFVPMDNSQQIYDAANPDTTRLVFTGWGSEHTQSYYDNKEAYSNIVRSFLEEFAPDFGNQ